MATDPLLVRFSGAQQRPWLRATSAASATALLVGAAAGAICVVAGLALPDPVGDAFVALGVGIPGLMLQDSWRFAFFAAGRPASACLNDALWSGLLLLALVGIHVSGEGTMVGCLLAFGGTASLAAVVGAAQAHMTPRPGLVGVWLREHRALSVRYLAENVTASGSSQVRAFVLGAVAGLASVGHVRAAEMLMGPFLVVLMGISQVAVPEASRVFQRSSDRLMMFCLTLGGVQAGAAMAWGVALLLVLPQGPGEALLRELWSPASLLIPVVILNVVAACFLTAIIAGLRAMGVARRSLRTQVTTSAAYLVAGTVGALWAGAIGTCWGVALANAFGASFGWYQLRTALAQQRGELGAVG